MQTAEDIKPILASPPIDYEERYHALRAELDRVLGENARLRAVALNAAIVAKQERAVRKARPATKGYRKLLRLEKKRAA